MSEFKGPQQIGRMVFYAPGIRTLTRKAWDNASWRKPGDTLLEVGRMYPSNFVSALKLGMPIAFQDELAGKPEGVKGRFESWVRENRDAIEAAMREQGVQSAYISGLFAKSNGGGISTLEIIEPPDGPAK